MFKNILIALLAIALLSAVHAIGYELEKRSWVESPELDWAENA